MRIQLEELTAVIEDEVDTEVEFDTETSIGKWLSKHYIWTGC